MRSPNATFCFAEAFVRNDSRLLCIWEAESKDMKAHVDKHWEAVKRKQAKASQLMSEISDLQQQLLNAEYNLSNETSRYNRMCHSDSVCDRRKERGESRSELLSR